MNRVLVVLFVFAAACGADSSGKDSAATSPWADASSQPDDLCDAHRAVVAAADTCADVNADYEEDACLDSYLGAYELDCLEIFITWVSCVDSSAEFTCMDEYGATYDTTAVCVAELDAYTTCVGIR